MSSGFYVSQRKLEISGIEGSRFCSTLFIDRKSLCFFSVKHSETGKSGSKTVRGIVLDGIERLSTSF